MRFDSLAGFWLAMLLGAMISGPAAADFDAAFEALDQKDYERARQEFEPLAAAGDKTAQFNLAVLHLQGLGTKVSKEVGADWLRKSAVQGYTEAAFALGMLYGVGDGIEPDAMEAYVWFRMASRKGHKAARKNLHRMTRRMNPDEIKRARALFDERTAELSD